MKLDIAKYGSDLCAILSVANPANDNAQNPTSATARFYQIVAGAFVAVPTMGPIALAQIDPLVTGVWGCRLPLTVDASTLIVLVDAIVAGAPRSVAAVSGGQTVRGPQITVTPGLNVQNSYGPTP